MLCSPDYPAENADSAPVLTKAPDSTNIAAMVQGAGLENTERASSYGRTPVARSADAPAIATTVGGKVSLMNSANISAMTARTKSGGPSPPIEKSITATGKRPYLQQMADSGLPK